MKVFVSSLDVPIGYTRPKFPSLYMPLGPNRGQYEQSFLYYTRDIWEFTVVWTVIFFGVFYVFAGLIAMLNVEINNRRHGVEHKRNRVGLVVIGATYVVFGAFKGFISGAIIGLILGAIYNAGSLSMSTWIPMTWGSAAILFDVCSSYSTSSIVL